MNRLSLNIFYLSLMLLVCWSPESFASSYKNVNLSLKEEQAKGELDLQKLALGIPTEVKLPRAEVPYEFFNIKNIKSLIAQITKKYKIEKIVTFKAEIELSLSGALPSDQFILGSRQWQANSVKVSNKYYRCLRSRSAPEVPSDKSLRPRKIKLLTRDDKEIEVPYIFSSTTFGRYCPKAPITAVHLDKETPMDYYYLAKFSDDQENYQRVPITRINNTGEDKTWVTHSPHPLPLAENFTVQFDHFAYVEELVLLAHRAPLSWKESLDQERLPLGYPYELDSEPVFVSIEDVRIQITGTKWKNKEYSNAYLQDEKLDRHGLEVSDSFLYPNRPIESVYFKPRFNFEYHFQGEKGVQLRKMQEAFQANVLLLSDLGDLLEQTALELEQAKEKLGLEYQNLAQQNQELETPSLDLVRDQVDRLTVVIDLSGSMSGQLEALKSVLGKIVDEIPLTTTLEIVSEASEYDEEGASSNTIGYWKLDLQQGEDPQSLRTKFKLEEIESLKASGESQVASALEQGVLDLYQTPNEQDIVHDVYIITDGELTDTDKYPGTSKKLKVAMNNANLTINTIQLSDRFETENKDWAAVIIQLRQTITENRIRIESTKKWLEVKESLVEILKLIDSSKSTEWINNQLTLNGHTDYFVLLNQEEQTYQILGPTGLVWETETVMTPSLEIGRLNLDIANKELEIAALIKQNETIQKQIAQLIIINAHIDVNTENAKQFLTDIQNITGGEELFFESLNDIESAFTDLQSRNQETLASIAQLRPLIDKLGESPDTRPLEIKLEEIKGLTEKLRNGEIRLVIEGLADFLGENFIEFSTGSYLENLKTLKDGREWFLKEKEKTLSELQSLYILRSLPVLNLLEIPTRTLSSEYWLQMIEADYPLNLSSDQSVRSLFEQKN